MAYIDYPYKNAYDGDDFSQSVSEIVEFALQWRLLRNLRRDGFMNVTNGGMFSGKDNDCFRVPVNHGCSLVGNILVRTLVASRCDVRKIIY